MAIAAVLGLTLFAMLVIWEVWQAWHNQDYTIKFIVPNGYRGVIILEEDKDRGVLPRVEPDDVYVYTIPASGKLTVKSFDLFRRYHFDAAQYVNGETLKTMTPKTMSNGNNPKDIVLRGLGSVIRDKERMIDSVGDYADYQKHAYEYGFTTRPPEADSKNWGRPLPRPWP